MKYKQKRGNVIRVTDKERELGVRVKCFEQQELKNALEDKIEWFSKRSNLSVLKQKTRVLRGKGAVVGRWKSSKVYVSFIPKNKLENYKKYKSDLHEQRQKSQRLQPKASVKHT